MKPMDEAFQVEQAGLLVARLERISADSIWAHRSSGLRGGLLRWIEYFESTQDQASDQDRRQQDLEQLERLISQGFYMLEQAAREKTQGSIPTGKKDSPPSRYCSPSANIER